jgi:hypothetical protein
MTLMGKRAMPLPKGHPVYEHFWSVYPDKMRISMDDGKVVDYVRVEPQPAPVLTDRLDRFTEICAGRKLKWRKRKEPTL